MIKIDLKKTLKNFYQPSAKEISFVNIPTLNFIMLDGKGDPNISIGYKQAIEALFSLAYALKFSSKKSEINKDYTVMPLEALWWVESGKIFSLDKKEDWQWTVMIMQPEWITESMFKATKTVVAKKKLQLPIDKIYFQAFTEGSCVQILHIGSYQDEAPKIQKMHDAILKANQKLCGKHHEIYLNDPRKIAPHKLKTILRQPYRSIFT